MTESISSIIAQCHKTFSDNTEPQAYNENYNQLIHLIDKITNMDLNLDVDSALDIGAPENVAPIRYMHVDEKSTFSAGVFMLREGAKIPLHDHPLMNGIIKTLHGNLRMIQYTKLDISRGFAV